MDYKNGKIYRVVCSETDRQYIGSTCSTLVKRLSHHKKKSNSCMTKDFIDGKIFLIEDYPCERKEQLLMRERFYMESMECVNLKRPIVTKEEELKEKKEYRQKNKEHISNQKKAYYHDNKDHLLKKQKEYCEKNKEKIKQYHKEYQKNNKEQLSKKRKVNFDCECGGKYQHSDKAKHIKTNKHQAYLSSIV
jgi:hypothetical protein